MNMHQPIQAEEERTMAMRVEADATERDQLAQWGFSAEEIVSLLWLRQWYQTGGSDRVQMVCHLEFLRSLVLNGKLEL